MNLMEKTNMKNTIRRVVAGFSLAILTLAISSRSSFAPNPVTLENDPAAKGSMPYEETVRRYLQNQQPKIVGGKPAPVGAFPWQVSLGVSWIADLFSAHFCGGSVLSAKWIVTAAHCAERLNPGQIIVTAGTTRLVDGVTRRNVNRIIVHRSYDRQNQDN